MSKKQKKNSIKFFLGPSEVETRFVKSAYLLQLAKQHISFLVETSRRAGMKKMHSDFASIATSIGHIENQLNLPYGLLTAWGKRNLRHYAPRVWKSMTRRSSAKITRKSKKSWPLDIYYPPDYTWINLISIILALFRIGIRCLARMSWYQVERVFYSRIELCNLG